MSRLDTYWNNLEPFKFSKAIAWVEATRRSYNDLNRSAPGSVKLTFAVTVEMIRKSSLSSPKDHRALKALEIMRDKLSRDKLMRDKLMVDWLNGLSSEADDSAVKKIQKRFKQPE